jgi:hypothetical protein
LNEWKHAFIKINTKIVSSSKNIRVRTNVKSSVRDKQYRVIPKWKKERKVNRN